MQVAISFLILLNLMGVSQTLFMDYHINPGIAYYNYGYTINPTILQRSGIGQFMVAFNGTLYERSVFDNSVKSLEVGKISNSMYFKDDTNLLAMAYNMLFLVDYAQPQDSYDALISELQQYASDVFVPKPVTIMPIPKIPGSSETLDTVNTLPKAVVLTRGSFSFLIVPHYILQNYPQDQYFYLPIGNPSQSVFDFYDVNGVKQPVSNLQVKISTREVNDVNSTTVVEPTVTLYHFGNSGKSLVKIVNKNSGYIAVTVSDRLRRFFDTVIVPSGTSVYEFPFPVANIYYWKGFEAIKITNVILGGNFVPALVPTRNTFQTGEDVVIRSTLPVVNPNAITIEDITDNQEIRNFQIIPIEDNSSIYKTQIVFKAPAVTIFNKKLIKVTERFVDSAGRVEKVSTYVVIVPSISLSGINVDLQDGILTISFTDDPMNHPDEIGPLTITMKVNGQQVDVYPESGSPNYVALFKLAKTIKLTFSPIVPKLGVNRVVIDIKTSVERKNGEEVGEYEYVKTFTVLPKSVITNVHLAFGNSEGSGTTLYRGSTVKLKVGIDPLYGGSTIPLKVYVNNELVKEINATKSVEIPLKVPSDSNYMDVVVVAGGQIVFEKTYKLADKPLYFYLLKNLWLIVLSIGIAVVLKWKYDEMYPKRRVMQEAAEEKFKEKVLRAIYYHVASVIGRDAERVYFAEDPRTGYYITLWMSVSNNAGYVLVMDKNLNTVIEFPTTLNDLYTLGMMVSQTKSTQTIVNYQQFQMRQQIQQQNVELEKAKRKAKQDTVEDMIEQDNEDFGGFAGLDNIPDEGGVDTGDGEDDEDFGFDFPD